MATLIYHAGALGDFITTLPVFSAWRARYPSERMVLLGKPAFGALAHHSGLIDEVWDSDRALYAGLFSDTLSDRLIERFGVFQHALLFCAGGSPLPGNLRPLIGHCLHQLPFPPDCGMHCVDYHLSMIGADPASGNRHPAIAMPRPLLQPLIQPGPGAGGALVVRGKTVALHPGSGSAVKNWPFERFIALADRLRKETYSVIWLAGESETALSFPPGDLLMRNRPLPEIVDALHRASLYIGNDSGIAHCAAACGCPCVVLFGPSDPRVWAPRGDRVRIIDAAPCCDEKRCHRKNKTNGNECPGCMQSISVDSVWDACRSDGAKDSIW